MIDTALPVSSATPNPCLISVNPRSNPNLIGQATSLTTEFGMHPATDGIWTVSSSKFSLVAIVLFVGAADQRPKNIELVRSCTSGDEGFAVITIGKPRLIESDLCANGLG